MTISAGAPWTTRFAPSPTGYLHLGHAYAALFAFDAARQSGGQFLLRIEDIDRTRSSAIYADALIDDLRWLGLEWHGPIRRQSDHLSDYAMALDMLHDRGLLYPCFCTRREIESEIAQSAQAPHGPFGALYPGTCRSLSADEVQARLSAGQPYALRLNMRKALAMTGVALSFVESGRGPGGETGFIVARPELAGDVVLARKDTPTSYHLCVTLDDARQGISLVTRGNDLFFATHVHRLLQALLELPTPVYRHHPLLCDSEGRRLSKRDKDKTLRTLRAEGLTPTDIRRLAGFT